MYRYHIKICVLGVTEQICADIFFEAAILNDIKLNDYSMSIRTPTHENWSLEISCNTEYALDLCSGTVVLYTNLKHAKFFPV